MLSDLRTRKKTVPVVHALESGTREGQRLRDLYDQPDELTDEQLAEAAEMVRRAGSEDWTRKECRRRLDAAEEQLAAGSLDDVESLGELAEFVIRRQL